MATPQIPDRLRRYAASHHGDALVDRLEMLAAEGIHDGQDVERVLTAIVLVAGEDGGRLEDAIALARADWRDVLVSAGLADEDWPAQLDRLLG